MTEVKEYLSSEWCSGTLMRVPDKEKRCLISGVAYVPYRYTAVFSEVLMCTTYENDEFTHCVRIVQLHVAEMSGSTLIRSSVSKMLTCCAEANSASYPLRTAM